MCNVDEGFQSYLLAELTALSTAQEKVLIVKLYHCKPRTSERQLPTYTVCHHQGEGRHPDSLTQQDLLILPEGTICHVQAVEDRMKDLYTI